MRLIPIGESGAPEEGVGDLSDVAREACASTAALYQAVGFVRPWIGYLGTVDGRTVGTCAFKAPARAGQVEIAYFTFPEFQRRGFATQMASALVALAAEAAPGVLVVAQTLPEQSASTAVLKRLGFHFAGAVVHPEDGLVWEWHLQTQAAERTRQLTTRERHTDGREHDVG